MHQLKKRLMQEIHQDIQLEIKHSAIWNVPVQVMKIDFSTVHQTKMDLLMKMLLIAFRESTFQTVEQLSEILLVEPVFIQHIVQKMLHAGLIQQEESFSLTAKGAEQLESEIFIDQYQEKTETLLYSPCHEQFFQHNIDEKEDDEYADYRFYDHYADWNVNALNKKEVREILQGMESDEEQENVQIIVEDILSIIPQRVEVIPCIEFQLYNKEQDIFYVRVWNTFLEAWDEKLETQINQFERENWDKQDL